MDKETEIKLRVSPAAITSLREHPLLNRRRTGEWHTGTLYNQYYDTAERDLALARVALRVRRDGEQYIQTLKSKGQSVAGLSERNEWDWPTDGPGLDLTLLDDSCWPASLATLDKLLLQPVFTTDFQRTKALLNWEHEGQPVQVEVALDQGQVLADGRAEPICELELELRSGPVVALLELATSLSADIALIPCDISKAERGYRLYDPASYELQLPAHPWSEQTTVDEVVAAAGWQLLGHTQRLAEQYRFSGQWRLFRELVARLVDLRAFFSVFDLGVPRSSTQRFTPRLDSLLAEYRPLVLAGWADDEDGRRAREQAPVLFERTLQDPAWGQLFLGLALWLHTGGWKQERPPRGDRVGALALPRWLLAAVAREIQELRVPHQNDDDRDVQLWLAQQPRLQRLGFLLGGFRQFLALPQVDHLYGELNKLQALLEQYPLVDDEVRPALLLALRKQGQKVRRLDAWRELNR